MILQSSGNLLIALWKIALVTSQLDVLTEKFKNKYGLRKKKIAMTFSFFPYIYMILSPLFLSVFFNVFAFNRKMKLNFNDHAHKVIEKVFYLLD